MRTIGLLRAATLLVALLAATGCVSTGHRDHAVALPDPELQARFDAAIQRFEEEKRWMTALYLIDALTSQVDPSYQGFTDQPEKVAEIERFIFRVYAMAGSLRDTRSEKHAPFQRAFVRFVERRERERNFPADRRLALNHVFREALARTDTDRLSPKMRAILLENSLLTEPPTP